MPAFHVSKSTHINAPADEVYKRVRDFKQWPAWSPWLISEPDCKLEYRDDGKGYSWDGKVVGAGEIEETGEDPSKSLDHKLTFLKPFKSEADVHFTLTEKDGGTEIAWSMDSSLPFFMFWMKNMMVAFIGSDYERGLSMLKDYVETGSVPSKLEFTGQATFPGTNYVGVKAACAPSEIGPSMEKNMKKLGEWLESSGTKTAGPPFSIYSKWNLVKGEAEYTIAFPVEGSAPGVPGGFVSGSLPAGNVYQIKHTGPYRNLGNAWTTGYAFARAKVFAQNKKALPFEIYVNDPTETDEKDLVTVVHFPMK